MGWSHLVASAGDPDSYLVALSAGTFYSTADLLDCKVCSEPAAHVRAQGFGWERLRSWDVRARLGLLMHIDGELPSFRFTRASPFRSHRSQLSDI